MSDFAKLQSKLNIKFRNPKLVFQAFTHRSYLNEAKDKQLISNERLEFLGDSILSFLAAKYFYNHLKSASEGTLTTIRAKIVQTKTLATAAKELKLGDYLLLSKGEERSGGRENETLLANTFEALIGAIFLDQGLAKTEQFVIANLLSKYQRLANLEAIRDYKSLLQQLTQNKFHVSPVYKLVSESGLDHAKTFKVAVFVNGQFLGEGVGKSKQQAQQQAAKVALERQAGK